MSYLNKITQTKSNSIIKINEIKKTEKKFSLHEKLSQTKDAN